MRPTIQKQTARNSAKSATQPSKKPNYGSAAEGIGALVHMSRGVPVTDTPTIANEFGRRHDNVMQTVESLIADGTLNLLDFKEITYLDTRNRRQPGYELTERGALVAMPFIGGRNSRIGQARLVDSFLAMRAQLAERQPAARSKPAEAPSTTADRAPLAVAIARLVFLQGVPCGAAWTAANDFAGVKRARNMRRGQVRAATRFVERLLAHTATPADFDRIAHNRIVHHGVAAQLPLIGGDVA